MPRRSLAGENKSTGANQFACVIGDATKHYPPLARFSAAAQAVANGVGLLEDFLEHVMLVIAQLIFLELVLELADGGGNFDVVDGRRLKISRLEDGHFVVVQINHLRRVLDNRAGVRCNHIFILPHANNQRRTFSRYNQRIRLILADDGDAVGAFNFMQCGLHGLGQR